MRISFLADTGDLVAQLVPGLLAHWRTLVPEDTFDARMQRFRAHMNRDELPIAWLAHQGDRALGTAALRASDLPGREDLSPWLGGVYVAPEYRGRGIASALCRVVETRAKDLGFDRLYLFTLDRQSLYQRLGWQGIECISWRGHPGDLMVKHLGEAPPRG